jgi:beta-barrel assembly-enhancing protease
VGRALAAKSPREGLHFEFAVVNSWGLSAWCLPGGKIAVNLGLLDAMKHDHRSFGGRLPTFEEKVASVLSHEITHATARHFGRTMEFKILMAALIKVYSYALNYLIRRYYDQKIDRVKYVASSKEVQEIETERKSTLESTRRTFDVIVQFVASGLGKCGSRSHELEADKYGMHLMQAALKPSSAESAIWLQQFFIHQKNRSGGGLFEWLSSLTSTHPSSQERLEANQQTWDQISQGCGQGTSWQ